MLDFAFLKEIGFAEEDIPYILERNEKYTPALAPLAASYRATFGGTELLPYPGDEREEAYQRAKDYVAAAIALFPEEKNPHILNLLAWLQLIPYLEARYAAYGFSRELIRHAYETTIAKAKEPSLSYANAVLESWYAKGLKTPEDVDAAEAERNQGTVQKTSFATDDFFEAALKRSYAEMDGE